VFEPAPASVVELSGVRFSWPGASPPAVDLESLTLARGEGEVDVDIGYSLRASQVESYKQ